MPNRFHPTVNGSEAPFYFDPGAPPPHPEERWLTSSSGVRVRSHPERQIAEALASTGLTWFYEPALRTAGSSHAIAFPDFVIVSPSGYAWVWEHHGMLEQSRYLADAVKKRRAYDALDIIRSEFGGGDFASLILTSTHGTSRLPEKRIREEIGRFGLLRASSRAG